MAAFTLSRATSEDIPEIVQVQWGSFPTTFVRELFMGCFSPADLPRLAASYQETLATDSTDIWIKVTEKSSGKIVGAANWNLYTGSEAVQTRGLDCALPWLTGDAAAASNAVFGVMNDIRVRANPGPFLHLHICFTSPSYRRRGIGSMMMTWGCTLADTLFLPSWIEASEEGNYLYKRFGFHDFQKVERDGESMGMCMRRNARTA